MPLKVRPFGSIAVLTSGGDAPGMNAAIRTVVRLGINEGWEVFGVRNGYAGLLEQRIEPLGARDVGSILQRGGTVLGSARFPEWKDEAVRVRALANLRDHRIEALVVIGGNGSQTGAYALSQMGFPVVGIASTIDNDLACSDVTIGVDTALNIALESIDRLRTTASSHKRAFVVEVMGRNCGYLALMAGIAGGAEAIVIPEAEVDPEDIAADLRAAYARGKPHALVVVAEGAKLNAAGSAEALREQPRSAGIRHAGDHARSRAAGRRSRRVRSSAGDAFVGGCRRAPGPRPARLSDRFHRGAGPFDAARRSHDQHENHRFEPAETRTSPRCLIGNDFRRADFLVGSADRPTDGDLGDRLSVSSCTCRWPEPTVCGIRGRRTTPRSRVR